MDGSVRRQGRKLHDDRRRLCGRRPERRRLSRCQPPHRREILRGPSRHPSRLQRALPRQHVQGGLHGPPQDPGGRHLPDGRQHELRLLQLRADLDDRPRLLHRHLSRDAGTIPASGSGHGGESFQQQKYRKWEQNRRPGLDAPCRSSLVERPAARNDRHDVGHSRSSNGRQRHILPAHELQDRALLRPADGGHVRNRRPRRGDDGL